MRKRKNKALFAMPGMRLAVGQAIKWGVSNGSAYFEQLICVFSNRII